MRRAFDEGVSRRSLVGGAAAALLVPIALGARGEPEADRPAKANRAAAQPIQGGGAAEAEALRRAVHPDAATGLAATRDGWFFVAAEGTGAALFRRTGERPRRICDAPDPAAVERLGLCPELFGAAAAFDPRSNDQPAVQRAIDLLDALGGGTLRFRRARYALWCPRRMAPALDAAEDGHPLVVRRSQAWAGASGGTELIFFGPGGTDPETHWQVVPLRAGRGGEPTVWRGGGLRLLPHAPGALARLRLSDLAFTGRRRRTAVAGAPEATHAYPVSLATGDGWDLFDKGFWVQDAEVGEFEFERVAITGFKGELWYAGGLCRARATLRGCTFRTTNANAFNPGGGVDRLVVEDCRFGDAYQAVESVGREGQVWRNVTLFDSLKASILGGTTDAGTRFFPFATRNEGAPPPWVELHGLQVERVDELGIGNWIRGTIRSVDCTLSTMGDTGWCRDIDLDVEAWCDRSTGRSPLYINGPANLTTPVTPGPPGVLHRPPSNIRIRLRPEVTPAARAAGRGWRTPFHWLGLLDRSVAITIAGGEAQSHPHAELIPALSMPLIEERGLRVSTAGGDGFNGVPFNASAGVNTLVVSCPLHPLFAPGPGVYPIRLGHPFPYAETQRVRLAHGGGAGVAFTFAAAGAGMRLAADRRLDAARSHLDLVFRDETWTEATPA